MVDVNKFFKFLNKNDIKFFSGVPDSVLKNTRWIFEKKNKRQHIITANEGSAIASCIGYFLATGKIPCAYMQNSGLGNTINPLLSLADPAVYAVPMLLLVGWRGEPGTDDEPQHAKQGLVTRASFEAMGVPCEGLESEEVAALAQMKRVVELA